jgi:hypothetical protein
LSFVFRLLSLLAYTPITLHKIGDKIDDLTGDVITLHQQQLLVFPDYDELGPFLRQRAKVVPLATNESDPKIPESGGFASAASAIPPPPPSGLTVDPQTTVGASSTQTSILDAVAGLQTFDYGDDRNANLTDLAAAILTINNNVNSQNDDTDFTATGAYATSTGKADITTKHIKHFMEEHQSLVDETRLEDEDTETTAMEAHQTFQEQLNAESHSPTVTSRSGIPRATSFQALQDRVGHPLLQRTYDKTPDHNAVFGHGPRHTPDNISSGSSSSLFLQRAHEDAAKASVRNKAAANMTDTQVLSEN